MALEHNWTSDAAALVAGQHATFVVPKGQILNVYTAAGLTRVTFDPNIPAQLRPAGGDVVPNPDPDIPPEAIGCFRTFQAIHCDAPVKVDCLFGRSSYLISPVPLECLDASGNGSSITYNFSTP